MYFQITPKSLRWQVRVSGALSYAYLVATTHILSTLAGALQQWGSNFTKLHSACSMKSAVEYNALYIGSLEQSHIILAFYFSFTSTAQRHRRVRRCRRQPPPSQLESKGKQEGEGTLKRAWRWRHTAYCSGTSFSCYPTFVTSRLGKNIQLVVFPPFGFDKFFLIVQLVRLKK